MADPLGYTRREAQHLKNAGATTYTSVGLVAPTASTTTNADDDTAPLGQYATTTTLGNTVGVVTAFSVLRRAWAPEWVARVKTAASVADVGLWAGLFSASPDNAADPAIHIAGFRYYTSTDGTAFWRCVTKDGTTATVTTTTVAVTVDTAYTLRVDGRESGNVRFYINGILVATHTANLPGSSTPLGWAVRLSTLTTAAKNLKYSRAWLSHA